MALLFGLGGFFYITILIVNAIAILSEDRFLARVGMGSSTPQSPGFGGAYDTTSVKAKIVHLIASVRTLMRIPLIVINTFIIIYELLLG